MLCIEQELFDKPTGDIIISSALKSAREVWYVVDDNIRPQWYFVLGGEAILSEDGGEQCHWKS